MLGKAGSILTFLVMGSVFVCAAPVISSNEGINNTFNAIKEQSGNIEEVFDQALNDKFVSANDPLEVYHSQLLQVKNPSYETLLPLLQKLAAYNEQFATLKDEAQLRALASKIAAPAQAGWNDYRKIDFNEIFDFYIPDNQQDKQVALLEYNVKSNTVSKEEQDKIEQVKHIEAAQDFMGKVDVFSAKMQGAKKFDGKLVIKEFIPVIKSYNALVKQIPGFAELARTSVFQKPIACGWGRTHNIVELRDNIGVIIYSGGDAFEYRTAGSLQKMYKGITKEEANLFADFTVNFYK